MGSSSGLLAHVTPSSKAIRSFGPAEGLINPDVFNLIIDDGRALWVSGRGGLFKADLNDRLIRFSRVQLPGGAEREPLRFLIDHKKQLWAGGRGVLSRLSNGEWHTFTVKDALEPFQIQRLAETADGVIWVGYLGAGISRLIATGDRLVVEDAAVRPNGKPAITTALGVDSRLRLWQTTDDGIAFLDGESWRHYGAADGLIWDDCNGNAFFGDHSMAFAPCMPGKSPRLQHVMFEVESLDDVMRSYHFLRIHKAPIGMGPGRHINCQTVHVYVQTPGGFAVELGWGHRRLADAHQPTVFPVGTPVDIWGGDIQSQEFELG